MDNSVVFLLNLVGSIFFGLLSFRIAHDLEPQEVPYGECLKWGLTALAICHFSSIWAILLVGVSASGAWVLTLVNFGLWYTTMSVLSLYPQLGVKYDFNTPFLEKLETNTNVHPYRE